FGMGRALFEGADAGNQIGLWVTDGTASGTQELTGIAGAYPGGLFGSVFPFGFFSLIDANFTVVKNNEVVFQGRDSTGQYGLWATDGTATGTHEIPGLVLPGFASDPFTAFNGEVLFDAVDTFGKARLWETDGTAAGTHQVAGVPAFGF